MAFQISSATDVKCPLAGTLMVVPFGFTAAAVAGAANVASVTQGIPYVKSVTQKGANAWTVTLNNSVVGVESIQAVVNANTATTIGDSIAPSNWLTNVNNGLNLTFDLVYVSAGAQAACPNSAQILGSLLVQNVGGIRGGT